MVVTRVARHGVEALVESTPTIGVGRVTAEAAAPDTGSDAVRISRTGVEVLVKVLPKVGVGRFTAEAAMPDTGSDVTRITRTGIEVLLSLPGLVGVGRFTAEAAAQDTGTDAVRISRTGIEILAKPGIPIPVPLALATDLEFFAHNWKSKVRMDSTYITDISRSKLTNAEERRSLAQKPARLLTIQWMLTTVTEVDRMIVNLRKLTGENRQMPLLQDGATLTVNGLSAETFFSIVTADKRFHNGARVMAVPQAGLKGYIDDASVIVRVISTVDVDKVNLTASIGQNITAG